MDIISNWGEFRAEGVRAEGVRVFLGYWELFFSLVFGKFCFLLVGVGLNGLWLCVGFIMDNEIYKLISDFLLSVF